MSQQNKKNNPPPNITAANDPTPTKPQKKAPGNIQNKLQLPRQHSSWRQPPTMRTYQLLPTWSLTLKIQVLFWFVNAIIGKIILGVLTGQLLLKLQESKIPINSFIPGIQLSPSFYFPSNLLMFFDAELNDVAAHFNCANAWSKLPKYEERCFS